MTLIKKIRNRNKCVTPLKTYSLLGHYLKMIPIEKKSEEKKPLTVKKTIYERIFL